MISIPRVLASAFKHPKVLVSLRRALTSTLVTANPYHRLIVEFASTFWDQNKSLPLPGDFELWYSGFDDQKKEGLKLTLHEIYSQPPEDWTPEYISKELTPILKDIASRNAVSRLGTMMPAVPPGAIAELADEIRAIEPVTLEGMLALADVGRHVFQIEEEPRLTTGFPSLDRRIGGFRNELIFVMADTGVGKTTLLVNFGAAVALRGARVLHLTFELSGGNTLKRYYRRISEVEPKTYRSSPGIVVEKVGHWLKMAKGSVHVLYQKAYSLSTEGLEALVDQFVDLHGGVDFIILDYLDLMKPPQGRGEIHQLLGQMSHTVRDLCFTYESTVMTATQTGRGGHASPHLKLDQIGASYQKAQAADIIISFVQTPEEYEANQARIGLPKVRESPGKGFEHPVYVNLDLMYVADLDHPNTKRLIEHYRHNPHPVFTDD